MDIQLPSSLERLIYDLFQETSLTRKFYEDLNNNGSASLPKELIKKLQDTFQSDTFDDTKIKFNMKSILKNYNYIADPHTCTSIALAQKLKKKNPIVAVGTASPIKFQRVVNEVFDLDENNTVELAESFDIIDNSLEKLIEKLF
jgi:threonine synthase